MSRRLAYLRQTTGGRLAVAPVALYHGPMPEDNLYANLPVARTGDERFDELLARPGVRIERIVSTGQASPPDYWYDQPEAEWVVLLQGAARLRFADEATDRNLTPGDWLYIAPHRRHRVAWTALDEVSVWLAVHFPDDSVAVS